MFLKFLSVWSVNDRTYIQLIIEKYIKSSVLVKNNKQTKRVDKIYTTQGFCKLVTFFMCRRTRTVLKVSPIFI